jgi:hypothetical protein
MIGTTLNKLKYIPNKIKRDIFHILPLKSLSKYRYQREIEKHVNHLPVISSTDAALIDRLQTEGVVVTSLSALAIPSTVRLNNCVEELLPKLLACSSEGKRAIGLSWAEQMKYSEIFLWGLEERLLDIVENYIGLPVLYHGADFRREIADGEVVEVRQWHIDPEDHRMVKVIVYLNDVDVDGGSFEYCSKRWTVQSSQILKYRSGFVSDQMMQTAVPMSNWQPCIGKSGTVIVADTCNIFHRAKAPVSTDRYSITW